MGQKVPLMIVPSDISNKIASKMKGIGRRLMRFFPHVKEDILLTDIDSSAEQYLALSLVNALFLAFLIGGLTSFLFWSKDEPVEVSALLGIAIAIGILIVFMVLYSRYPLILASKKAESIDKDLVFALKDLSMQISAGVSLYEAMSNIANSKYGETSHEFKRVVLEINTGVPMVNALEKMDDRTKSEYLKRTTWQIVNALKSGSNLKKTLNRIILDLSNEQRNRIRNYARELNLWSLIYMLFAVAVPSIGSTMLVILSSFAGFGVTKGMFIAFIVICIIIQYVLIGFVKVRRPVSGI